MMSLGEINELLEDFGCEPETEREVALNALCDTVLQEAASISLLLHELKEEVVDFLSQKPTKKNKSDKISEAKAFQPGVDSSRPITDAEVENFLTQLHSDDFDFGVG